MFGMFNSIMDKWAQSFKLIHGKTPTKADRAEVFDRRTPGCSKDEQENVESEFKSSELKPPEMMQLSTKINSKFRRALRKPQALFDSPTKSFGSFASESPKINNLLKTPSPKKLLRPTKACSNIHLLLKQQEANLLTNCLTMDATNSALDKSLKESDEVKHDKSPNEPDEVKHDKSPNEPDEDSEDEPIIKVFEDEMPEESFKLKNKKKSTGRTKKADSSGFEANYVKANLKRKRFVSKTRNADAKRFKRFKRAK